ncbi:DNA replication/repair protein RecF [Sporanaerobium hydrogeniformans]|uniref:DNA replication/repair protein RecF n=1 Tax=Sporanaerobium hydrogeniformans TaxID=3072179 RepID=A0AC61DDD2_9FIRM|nr:DNA replication/repair protein RecF [Sporanaerobium hydrogeniformans]PHV70627.1 DNA replication/repair protein RecF [Sporanaerobium hydrogeniformans]
MYIKELSLTDFRNYGDLDIKLDKGINIFKGDNAQGKTNILEAIYLCATARSHRTHKEKEIIKWGTEAAHVRIRLQKNYVEDIIDFHLNQNTKAVAINKLPIAKLGELFGCLNIVMFSPEDLQLIKNSPKERRRFIDIELCQIDKMYYYALRQYHKVLKQRNLTLKQYYMTKDTSMIDIWDIQLEQYALDVIDKREKFIEELNKIANKIHFDISGGKESLEVIYEPNVSATDYSNKMLKYREKDILYQNTSIGPHRDDLKFMINGMDVKMYGSQGQQRTVVLSMKLAELNIMKQHIGENPVLLLDDVLSELDDHRQVYLFKYTKNIQTFITCTGIEQSVWNTQKIGKLYYVKEGKVISKDF